MRYMRRDLNADQNSRGYFNHSIYYDSLRLRNYLEKHEGMLSRVKPRLRVYRPTPDAKPTAYFMELKNRSDRVVSKQRTKIGPELADSLLRPQSLEYSDGIASSDVLNRFYYMVKRYGMTPQVAVLYHREPLQSDYYPGLRITIDSRLQCAMELSLDAPPAAFRYALPPNTCILELKFNQKLPRLVAEDVGHFALTQVTFSKFAQGIEVNSTARDHIHRAYAHH